MSDQILDKLAQAVGGKHVLTEGDLSAHEHDWRKRYQGRALAVVRPASTEEVTRVLGLCAQARVSVVPQGGNTGLVGGSVPDATGRQVLLHLGRLNRVREVDTANLTLTAEAGCVLQQVQEAAAAHGLLFPLSMASEGSCTIGGNLASNAGGTQVLRYGNARELCLGLEVVTAQGEVWHGLTGLRKDNTGYDLRDLFIGSEGTLGVITAATLKLHPEPAVRCTALVAVPDLDAAVALLQRARSSLASSLTGFEVMNEASLALVAQHFPALPQALPASPWKVLLELSDHEGQAHARGLFERLLEGALEDGMATDAAIAESLDQSNKLWHLRESIPLAQAQEGLNIKHDISLPISRVAGFVPGTDALLRRHVPGVRLVNFGHLGDGNLHYNVQAPPGTDAAAFLQAHEAAVNRIVYDAVVAHGGSISAEHGIGQLKLDEMRRYKPTVALDMMRAIKKALDPLGVMNPGRVIPHH
jgi:FAD/FMN-containing dehydrogenase